LCVGSGVGLGDALDEGGVDALELASCGALEALGGEVVDVSESSEGGLVDHGECIGVEEGRTWSALPDLEAEVTWEGGSATIPVIFEDKHLFPVVESRTREDEQSLIAWFLGLRPAGEQEDGGFGHSIDPVRDQTATQSPTGDILSYLVRDFVHALPGIRNRLADGGMTETGLRAALLGHRSPVELAKESLRSFREPQSGKPRKTSVATAFQLVELKRLLATVPLPELADGVADTLRAEAVAEVSSALDDVVADLSRLERSTVMRAYLGLGGGRS